MARDGVDELERNRRNRRNRKELGTENRTIRSNCERDRGESIVVSGSK